MRIQIHCSFDVTDEEMSSFIKNNLENLLQERLDRWPMDVENVTITVEETS